MSKVITKLTTDGGPCGPGTEVSVERTGQDATTLICLRCGAKRTVAIRGGRINRAGFAKLEAGVRRLHDGDA